MRVMYTYLLFDLDGTLTDPKEGITRSVQYAFEKIGIIEPDLEKLTRFIGPPLVPAFMEYYDLTQEQAEEALRFYRERFQPIGIFENRVYEGISEMLKDLQQKGYVIALATSKPEVFAEKILEHFNLKSCFQCVVGSELDGRRTKKSEVIEEVFRRLEINERGKALMIGDRHHDIDGAAECGIDAVGVRFGYAQVGELEQAGARYIVDTVEELHQLLIDGRSE